MEEFYPQIRHVHIGAVIASGVLFAFRGVALNLFSARWAMAAPLRFTSYTIDTVLLTAALMLMTIVQQYPFVDVWLTAKVLLLALYIVLGSFALKRGWTRRVRIAFFLMALGVYGYIITIARAHHPLGLFAGGALP